MPANEYIKEEDKKRYVKPLAPGHPNYVRRKEQSWLKILGRGTPVGHKNYNKNFLDWCWTRMNQEQLPPDTIKYLKKALHTKWIEIDNYEKRQAKKEQAANG